MTVELRYHPVVGDFVWNIKIRHPIQQNTVPDGIEGSTEVKSDHNYMYIHRVPKRLSRFVFVRTSSNFHRF